MLKQYDKLRKRNAFLDGYKKLPLFKENLDEFDDSKYGVICGYFLNFFLTRAVVEQLVEEYKAAEKPDYLDWGFDDSKMDEAF